MRRREPLVDPQSVMPAELRRRPTTEADIDRWLGDERMPDHWRYQHHDHAATEQTWRRIHANSNWTRAVQAWRRENDPTYWWYKRRHESEGAR